MTERENLCIAAATYQWHVENASDATVRDNALVKLIETQGKLAMLTAIPDQEERFRPRFLGGPGV